MFASEIFILRRHNNEETNGRAITMFAEDGDVSQSYRHTVLATMQLLVLFGLLLLQNSFAVRILAVFSHPGRSHKIVFEPLLYELAHRGHNVTVVSFYPTKTPPKNYRDISLEGLAPTLTNVLNISQNYLWWTNKVVIHLLAWKSLADLAVNMCKKLCVHPPLQELLRSDEVFHVILVENFSSDCALGFTYKYKAPVIALLSHGIPNNPAIGTYFTESMDFSERVEKILFTILRKIRYRYTIQHQEKKMIEHYLDVKIPDLEELSINISLMLVNIHHSLNGVHPLLPGIIEIGGMHLQGINKSEKLSPNVEKFIAESQQGVILFSFGTLLKADSMSINKQKLFSRVFSRFPQRVIWKCEAEDNIIDSKIFKIKWFPQYALLHHPNVIAFIAHGGLLGMTEAVDAGVPMLVIPFFGDQPGNGAAAAEAGIATVLQYGELTEETLYTALKKVLSPEMRESAKRVSRVWRDRPMPPLETAVYWVERTARLGHDARMASRARHMPAYQLALLDVYAFLIACASLIIYINYLSIKKILSIIKHLLFTKKIKTH